MFLFAPNINNNMLLIILVIMIILICILLYMNYIHIKNKKSIYELAYHDMLTKAYNRNGIQQAYQKLNTNGETYIAVMMNICHFKFINHVFGYDIGDKLVINIKESIDKILFDDEIFYRGPADYFGIVMKQENAQHRLQVLMQNIEGSLDDINYPVYCQCGIAVIENNNITINDYFDKARLALETIRHDRIRRIAYYHQEMFIEFKHQNDVERLMEKALENNEFKLLIQPQYDLSSKTICGGEALVRWKKKDGKMVLPNEFISIFENNGFIAKLDLCMLEKLCEYQQNRKQRGLKIYPLSINQSRVLFYHKDYIQQLSLITKKYDIDPHMIILEITEGLFFDDLHQISQIIDKIHEIGFQIALDDFGIGYSSFDMIKEFNIDELKLDKMFVTQKDITQKSRIIIECIMEMSKKLGIKTVCEGIENENHVELLQSLGCDMLQGYFYSKPIEIEEFEKMIDKGDVNNV